MRRRDVVILGAGLSGLSAALRLRHLDVEVVDASDMVGGRTRSRPLPGGGWMNYGAQYITEDRPTVVELADSLGVRLLESENFEDYWRTLLPADPAARAEAEAGVARIEAEQANPRPLTLPELDGQSFADWLGPISEEASDYFERVFQLMNSSSIVELSVVGGFWVWGDQRTGPWNTPEIARHDRGELIVGGGTSELAAAAARAAGVPISLGTLVTRVRAEADGYAVETQSNGVRGEIRARRVVCALPGPVALHVIEELPDWKRAALSAVRYGRWISTPIVITPADRPAQPFPLVASRPRVRYNADNWLARTPGDMEEGGCFHSFMSDSAARVVWHDRDESIKSGAVRAFLAAHPQFAGRIERVDIHRWRYGLPQYRVGLMQHLPALPEAVGGIHFCGDYTLQSNMEGAVRSGMRAGDEVAAAL
jgi:predicted NAD/FAD-dependent oxidoreductase